MTIKATCLDDSGIAVKGRLADLSAQGLSVILPGELPEGSVVKVEWGRTVFVGEAIYCRPQGAEFLVGLKMEAAVADTSRSPQVAKRSK